MNQSQKPKLLIDFCSYQASKFAVEHWHYSKSMPTPPVIKIGVWENDKFIGCVLFSRGANNNMLKPYGLKITEGCELTRVALSSHLSSVTKIVAKAVKLLKLNSPDLRLIVSYADPNHNHLGIIYQAGNWVYVGQTSEDFEAIDGTGRKWHSRQVSHTGVKRQYGEYRLVPKIGDCKIIPLLGKFRYLFPLDKAMRRQIEPLAKPYPKRAGVGEMVKPPDDQSGDAGSIPAVRFDKSTSPQPG